MRPFVVIIALLVILLPILGVAAVGAATDCANRRCTHLPLLIAGGVGNAPDPSATGVTATATTPGTTATATTTATGSPTSGTAEPSGTATATQTSSATATGTATATQTSSATATGTTTATTTPTTPTTISNFTNMSWANRGMPSYPINASEGQAVVLNGKLFSFSGFAGPSFIPFPNSYAFDPLQNKWLEITDMPPFNNINASFGGGTHIGITTDGTYIYFAGAYSNNSSNSGQVFGSRYVWRYNPALDPKLNLALPADSQPYQRLADLPAKIRDADARGLTGNRAVGFAAGQLAYVEYTKDGELKKELHYIGGTNKQRDIDLDDHWAIDVARVTDRSAQWQPRAPLPNPRHHASSVVFGGKIYYIGGQHGHDGPLVAQSDVHIYDPASDSWQKGASLPIVPATTDAKSQGRNHVGNATFVLGGRIILVGGQSRHSTALATVLAYDPQANKWTQLTSLPQARHSAVAGAIDGRIYLSSGIGAGRSSLVGVPQLD